MQETIGNKNELLNVFSKRVYFIYKNGVIIYYSWVGNTKVVAEEIQRIRSFDLVRIEEIKVHKLGDIMGIALGAFFGFKSSIKTMDFSLDMVDNIFLGTQVWVGKTKSTS